MNRVFTLSVCHFYRKLPFFLDVPRPLSILGAPVFVLWGINVDPVWVNALFFCSTRSYLLHVNLTYSKCFVKILTYISSSSITYMTAVRGASCSTTTIYILEFIKDKVVAQNCCWHYCRYQHVLVNKMSNFLLVI